MDNVRSTTIAAYIPSERGGEMSEIINSEEPKIDMYKAFEAIASIIGARYNADIKVVSVRKRDKAKDETA